MNEKERDRQRGEHNQKLLKAHLDKLRADPGRFFQTTTASEETDPESKLEAEFEAEWQTFKRRYQGKVFQVSPRRAGNPKADFTLLGVEATASRAEIRRAFLVKAKTAHPDHGGNADAFRDLMEAYHRLTGGKG